MSAMLSLSMLNQVYISSSESVVFMLVSFTSTREAFRILLKTMECFVGGSVFLSILEFSSRWILKQLTRLCQSWYSTVIISTVQLVLEVIDEDSRDVSVELVVLSQVHQLRAYLSRIIPLSCHSFTPFKVNLVGEIYALLVFFVHKLTHQFLVDYAYGHRVLRTHRRLYLKLVSYDCLQSYLLETQLAEIAFKILCLIRNRHLFIKLILQNIIHLNIFNY